MVDGSVRAPVALIIYNRPDMTATVLRALRRIRPSRLFVIADGPDPAQPGDDLRCAAARDVVESVDWPCRVENHLAEEHLGCRRRVSSGLDWLFGQVDEAIVLEDDCVPDDSFFRFCDELLERYRDETEVMQISGSTVLRDPQIVPGSYGFSRYPLIWGWASWRRVWQQYDVDIAAWPGLRTGAWLGELLEDRQAALHWQRIFDGVRDGFDSWDYSLTFACWLRGGLCVHPARNMVCNIGFGADATHTRDAASPLAGRVAEQMAFPLVHPGEVRRNPEIDRLVEQNVFSGNLHRTLQLVRQQLHARRR